MSIFAFCAFLPREFERNRTLSKKTIYRLRKFLGWCIIKLKIRLRIFLYTPVLCLWSSDDRNYDEELDECKFLSDRCRIRFIRTAGRSSGSPFRVDFLPGKHVRRGYREAVTFHKIVSPLMMR